MDHYFILEGKWRDLKGVDESELNEH